MRSHMVTVLGVVPKWMMMPMSVYDVIIISVMIACAQSVVSVKPVMTMRNAAVHLAEMSLSFVTNVARYAIGMIPLLL